MLDKAEIDGLKRKFLSEVRPAFEEPTAPRYPFQLSEAVDTLFDILVHETGDWTGLQVKVEPFCMMLLRLIKEYPDCLDERVRTRREQGEHWLYQAAIAGHADARMLLAAQRLHGTFLPRDLVEGERLLREGVAEGDTDCMVLLGESLIEGGILRTDTRAGLALLAQAAEAESGRAARILGVRLFFGRDVDADLDEGAKWLQQYSPGFAAFCRGWRDYLDGRVEAAADSFAESAELGEVTARSQRVWLKRRRETKERHHALIADLQDLYNCD